MSCGTILPKDLEERSDALLKGFQISQENNSGFAGAVEASGLTEEVFRKTLKEIKNYNYEAYKTIASFLGIEDIGDMF